MYFLFWLKYIIKKEQAITIGIETSIGEAPKRSAKEIEAKLTSERLCPISEYLFKTSKVPRSAAQIETKAPIIRALIAKE